MDIGDEDIDKGGYNFKSIKNSIISSYWFTWEGAFSEMFFEGYKITPFYSMLLYVLNFIVDIVVNGYLMGLVGGAVEVWFNELIGAFLGRY